MTCHGFCSHQLPSRPAPRVPLTHCRLPSQALALLVQGHVMPQHVVSTHLSKHLDPGTSMAVQQLRLCASTAGGAGSIPRQGAQILHAVSSSQKTNKKQNWSLGPKYSESHGHTSQDRASYTRDWRIHHPALSYHSQSSSPKEFRYWKWEQWTVNLVTLSIFINQDWLPKPQGWRHADFPLTRAETRCRLPASPA